MRVCCKGHEWKPENRYIRTNGRDGGCKICAKASAKEWAHQHPHARNKWPAGTWRGKTVYDRFWENVLFGPEGCWIWGGYRNDVGYGQLRHCGRTYYAHRFSYELHKGEIPNGLDLDHLCRVRCCVNPDHLEAVTRKENLRRGLHISGQAKKTHCTRGHEYSGANLYRRPGGGRDCKACMRMRAENRREVAN